MNSPSKPVFALVDCNNFYASCEKLFRPDLKHTPVVVLSNNDGCVVARCGLAKSLGIKMGAPYFKAKQELASLGVVVFSSNYPLYGDISNRVMTVLEQMAFRVERYSIDEAFLDLTGMEQLGELSDFGFRVRGRVQQWTGITTCVGIAPTKTLAKLANAGAKQYPATGGVVDLTESERQRRLMALMPVGEVWGVGRRNEEKLLSMGIHTALQLAQASPKEIRSRFSVVLERTLCELNGESCLELEEVEPARQQIVCGRSFGDRVVQLSRMREIISKYIGRAVEKLRLENQTAQNLSIAIRTSGFNPSEAQYSNTVSSRLVIPTSDTRCFTALAIELLDNIWRDGYRYAKAEVMLSEFLPAGAVGSMQGDLFAAPDNTLRQIELMKVVDQINASGKGRIFLARQGMQAEWGMRQDFLSPAYTTRWDELPIVR